MKRGLPFLIFIFLIAGSLWSQEGVSERRLALRNLAERADSGDAKALFDLARLHDTGYDSIPVDSLRSAALYLLSAHNGFAPARNFIGFRYYKGEAIKQDIDSALFWIEAAADAGDITAAANLGYLLSESPGIPHDSLNALKWITIAAEAGVKEAQEKLIGWMEPEWKKLPSDSALAMGLRYYTGEAPILGVFLLQVAAEDNLPKSLALLGDAYSKGLGVAYDHQKSLDYFFKAALTGDPSAQFIIAELLEIFPETFEGLFEEKENDAVFWYEKAKEGGVEDAESAYKLLYSLPAKNSLNLQNIKSEN